MSLKIDILKAFLDHKYLCDAMKACDHGHNGEINPYHMESSLWCHTMLVYNQADPYDKIELIMALCHDIGKVATRQVKDNGKVSFYGHADASIQPTIDFVSYLYNEGIITRAGLTDAFMKWGLPAMANHMLYYQNINKKYHFVGDNRMIKHYLNRMADMDAKGSLCKEAKVKESLSKVKYVPYIAKEWNDDLPTVTIWTGLPGSGKDYLAKKTRNPIISFDDIRVETYKKFDENWHLLSEKDLYSKAFIYCNENNIDLMKLLKKRARIILDNERDINICNTSLTRKSRCAIINTIGTKYNYVVKQVFAPFDVILERNKNRNSKIIPEDVINRMCKHMTVATHFEPHINEIEYKLNL